MRPIIVSVGPLAAASANGICLSQTPTSGTALTLNGAVVSGGVAILDAPRRVLLTYGNEGGARTLVVTGTDVFGMTISETLSVPSGAAGTVYTVLDYKTITSLVPAGSGWTAAVTVGTNSIASSRPVFLDTMGWPNTMLQVTVSGTVSYTLQQSADDPNVVGLASVVWQNHSDPALVNSSTSTQTNYFFTPFVSRILLNSGTGSVTYTITQAGGAGR